MSDQGLHPLAEPTPGLTQWQRVIYTFSAPSKTCEDIQRGNRSWWLPLILISAVTYILFAVISFQIGMQQVIDNQIHLNPKAEERLAQLTPEQREDTTKVSVYFTEGVFIANPILTTAVFALLALGLWGTINFIFGGRASYGGILAVWFYAALPSIIKALLGTVVLFAGIAPESFNVNNFAPTNIGAFLNPLETNTALYTLATALDVVQIWTLVLVAIGTATVAGVKRNSGYIAVFGWWAIFVLIRVGWAAING
jgi:hypothetical protein